MDETSKEAIVQLVFGVIVILLLLLGWNFVSPLFNTRPVEVSGIVMKYDDCREIVMLNDEEYKKQRGTFVCDLSKTNSGKVIGGLCIKTVTDSSGQCQTAYFHGKSSEITCGDNSSPNIDDTCTCNDGYASNGSSCISYDQDCKNLYGSGSYSSYENGKNLCGCSDKYVWNSQGDSCVTRESVNQLCRTNLGPDSYYLGYVTDGNYICE